MEKTVGFIGGVVLGAVLAGAFGVDFFPTGASEGPGLKTRGEVHGLRREVAAYHEALLQREAELAGAKKALQVALGRAPDKQASSQLVARVALERRAEELSASLAEVTGKLHEVTGKLHEVTGKLHEVTGQLHDARGQLESREGRLESQLESQNGVLEETGLALASLRSTVARRETLVTVLREEWHDSLMRFLQRREGPGDAMLVAEYLSSAQSDERKRELLLYLRQNRPGTLLALPVDVTSVGGR